MDRVPVPGENYIRMYSDGCSYMDRRNLDSVELSNICREFYRARQQAAAEVKAAISGTKPALSAPSSIHVAMETLKSEMACLMEQDLSLMKQLLTLNEAIEDLKWQRRFSLDQSSSPSSSCDLSTPSDWLPASETEAKDSIELLRCKKFRVEPRFTCVENRACNSSSQELQFDFDIDSQSNQGSLDSGIHDNRS